MSTPRLTSRFGTPGYRIDWRACLRDPKPTEELRRRGHTVYVDGPDDEYGDFEYCVLGPLGHGMPEPWETMMVALGTQGKSGLLYSREGRPAISNGAVLFFVDLDVVDALERCETSMEIPPDSKRILDRQLVEAATRDAIELAGTRARVEFDDCIVKVGPAFFDARFIAAAISVGATHMRPMSQLGPALVDDVGVIMPMKMRDELYD